MFCLSCSILLLTRLTSTTLPFGNTLDCPLSYFVRYCWCLDIHRDSRETDSLAGTVLSYMADLLEEVAGNKEQFDYALHMFERAVAGFEQGWLGE